MVKNYIIISIFKIEIIFLYITMLRFLKLYQKIPSISNIMNINSILIDNKKMKQIISDVKKENLKLKKPNIEDDINSSLFSDSYSKRYH
jgi:hypothetical protein